MRFSEFLRWSQVMGSYFRGGNIAIRRVLFEQMQWTAMAIERQLHLPVSDNYTCRFFRVILNTSELLIV